MDAVLILTQAVAMENHARSKDILAHVNGWRMKFSEDVYVTARGRYMVKHALVIKFLEDMSSRNTL